MPGHTPGSDSGMIGRAVLAAHKADGWMVRLPLPGNKAHDGRRGGDAEAVGAAPRGGSPCRVSRLLSGLLACALVLLLPACSFVGFAWQRADGAIMARAQDWLDLDAGQEARLAQRVTPWLERVRRRRLPEVAAFLDQLAARTTDGFSSADAGWADERFWTLYDDVVGSAIEWIAPALASLEPAQRRHLARRMEERNASYRAEYVDVPEPQRQRALAQRIVRQVERWTGPLDARQRDLVRARAAKLPDTAPAWYDYRLRMQAGLLALIDAGASAGEIEAHLRDWWIEFSPRRAAEVAGTRALRAGIRGLLVELAATLRPGQRRAAIDRFRDLGADLAELARDTG